MYLFHHTAPVPRSISGEVIRRSIFWCVSKWVLRSLLFVGDGWRGVIPDSQPSMSISTKRDVPRIRVAIDKLCSKG